MLRIALVDDENDALMRTRALLKDWRTEDAQIDAFSSGGALLSAMDSGGAFDIYLLDVIMPEMDGIALGHAVRSRDEDGSIIFLTTSPDFALNGYDVWALQYLIKPVDAPRLHDTLDRAAALQNRRKDGHPVHTKNGDIFLCFDDILYAEKYGRLVRYFCRDAVIDSTTLVGAFSAAAKPMLDSGRFYLCGKTLAVNLAVIEMVDKDGVVFSNGTRLALARTPCRNLRLAWMRYYLKGGGRT